MCRPLCHHHTGRERLFSLAAAVSHAGLLPSHQIYLANPEALHTPRINIQGRNKGLLLTKCEGNESGSRPWIREVLRFASGHAGEMKN